MWPEQALSSVTWKFFWLLDVNPSTPGLAWRGEIWRERETRQRSKSSEQSGCKRTQMQWPLLEFNEYLLNAYWILAPGIGPYLYPLMQAMRPLHWPWKPRWRWGRNKMHWGSLIIFRCNSASLKLQCAQPVTWDFVQITSWFFRSEAWDSAFLTSSQVMPVLLACRPCCEEQGWISFPSHKRKKTLSLRKTVLKTPTSMLIGFCLWVAKIWIFFFPFTLL